MIFLIKNGCKDTWKWVCLDKFRFRKEIDKSWFMNRIVDEWNKLSSNVIDANTRESFKRSLERFMVGSVWW